MVFSDGGTAPAAVLERAGAHLALVADRLPAAMSDDELVDGVAAIQVLTGQLAALQAGLLAEVDAREVAKKKLHWGSTSDWFTHLGGLTRRDGRRAVAHARQLVEERPDTLAALRRGETSPAQAGIICDALAALPRSPGLRAEAERVLLEESRRLNATDLARTARHLVHVVDPDREERKAEGELDREERAAHLERFLSATEDGAGGGWIKGRGSAEDIALLRATLLPLTAPAPGADPDDPSCVTEQDPRDHGARMWDALVELARRSLTAEVAPAGHGARPRLSIMLNWQALVDGMGEPAVTDDGLRLSVAAVRRLACDADLIPVCLGSSGEVLDVGRVSRLVTAGIWRALVARDRHCAFPGCTRPPVMGHAHHIVHWADGGKTSLDNLVLVCGSHHRVLHHSPWQVRISPADGKPEFLPPPDRYASPATREWIRHRPRRE